MAPSPHCCPHWDHGDLIRVSAVAEGDQWDQCLGVPSSLRPQELLSPGDKAGDPSPSRWTGTNLGMLHPLGASLALLQRGKGPGRSGQAPLDLLWVRIWVRIWVQIWVWGRAVLSGQGSAIPPALPHWGLAEVVAGGEGHSFPPRI